MAGTIRTRRALARGAARGGRPREPRPAEDLPRRRARRRQDLRDAAGRPGAAGARASTSSSAWSRPTAAPRPRRCSTGLEVVPRRQVDYQGRALEEMDLDAILARRPAARPGRRAGPHQRAGQPPSQALPGRRGAARRRHRRLHHAQRPARREPERRGRADHPHPRARDRARLDPRPRRRDRAVDLTPDDLIQRLQGGQGLRAASRRSARSSTTSRPATSPRCASSRCAAPPQRVDEQMLQLHAGARHRRARGRPASACWSASASDPSGAGARAPRQAHGRAAARRPGPRSTSRPPRALHAVARPSATGSPRRCGWPSSSAARPSRCPAATSPRRSCAYAEAQQRHPHRHRQAAGARAGASCCTARSPTTLIRSAGGISVHVVAGRALEPAPPKTRRDPAAHGRASTSRPYLGDDGCWSRRRSASASALRAVPRRRRTSRWSS